MRKCEKDEIVIYAKISKDKYKFIEDFDECLKDLAARHNRAADSISSQIQRGHSTWEKIVIKKKDL